VFAEGEFRPLLEEAGFEVVETVGLEILWGLLEYDPLLHVRDAVDSAVRKARAFTIRRRGEGDVAPGGPAGGRTSPGSILKRLLVHEDRTVPLLGAGVRLAATLVPNLRMYVARPRAT
jgi:hypothetical protein